MNVLADLIAALREVFPKIIMSSNLTIMEWNGNGLLKHQQKLQALLDIENIDLYLIFETYFTNKPLVKFNGYKENHTIRAENAAKISTAIVIKESIKHYQEMRYKAE